MVTVPDGDVLVFAGDFASKGDEIYHFAQWWNKLPHKHKVLVAGNHDRIIDVFPHYVGEMFERTYYLRESGVDIEGLLFWGSPGTLAFTESGAVREDLRGKRWAFQLTPNDAGHRAELIPESANVVITHGPSAGVLDGFEVPIIGEQRIIHLGDPYLYATLEETQPMLHIFGHVHGGYGTTKLGETECHNVAICNENYEPVNAPHVIDL